MSANLTAKYLWEVNALAQTRSGLSLEELNQQWVNSYLYDDKDIPRKTWWEHRKQIEIQFGINIEYNKHTNRYYIQSKEEVNHPALQEWLLNNFAISHMLEQGKSLRHRILCEHVPSGYEYLTEIIQAMRESKCLTLTYQSFWETEAQKITVEPYFVKVFKQRWYLGAYSPDKYGLRIYALDRIQHLRITDQKFKMPKNFDAEAVFATAYGIVVDQEKKVERIEINVYNHQANYFRSLPLHPSQKEIETSEDGTVFEYHLQPTYDFIQELLLHGPDVEVIHPNSLRQIMKQRITEMAELYQ